MYQLSPEELLLCSVTVSTPELEHKRASVEPRRVGRFKLGMPYSEVCMSMRVAGQVLEVEDVGQGMAQLYKDGVKFSTPITHGEAGLI